VAPGQVRNEFVNLIDLFPTLLQVSGAETALAAYDGPGKSLLPLLKGDRSARFRDLQFAEMGNARMAHNGRWKLVRYFQQDQRSAPEDHWFDLAHPLGERFPVAPPSASQQQQLSDALEAYFSRYETMEHSGKRVWELPRHNAMEPWRQQK